MTTYTQPVTASPRWPLAAVLGAGAALVLTAVGTFKDESGVEGWREYGITSAVVLVVTAIVFWLAVRTANASNAGARSLTLGIAALLGLALFWLGLPAVLAAASICCALVRREQDGRFGAAAATGTAISAVATVLAVVIAIVG